MDAAERRRGEGRGCRQQVAAANRDRFMVGWFLLEPVDFGQNEHRQYEHHQYQRGHTDACHIAVRVALAKDVALNDVPQAVSARKQVTPKTAPSMLGGLPLDRGDGCGRGQRRRGDRHSQRQRTSEEKVVLPIELRPHETAAPSRLGSAR